MSDSAKLGTYKWKSLVVALKSNDEKQVLL